MEIIKDDAYLQHAIEKYKIADHFTDFERYRKGVRLVRFAKNSFIYSQQEHLRYIYFLVEGSLQVYATAENGEQMLVRYCDDFIFLGDMEFLGFQEPSNLIETISDCFFVAIDFNLMREALMEDTRFLRFLCHNLAEKINYFAKTQFHNKMITPRQKVLSHILEVGGAQGYFKENLRHTAELLEISYRHLHRILGELVELGVLERSSRGYEIKKIKRLEELYWEYQKDS